MTQVDCATFQMDVRIPPLTDDQAATAARALARYAAAHDWPAGDHADVAAMLGVGA